MRFSKLFAKKILLKKTQKSRFYFLYTNKNNINLYGINKQLSP